MDGLGIGLIHKPILVIVRYMPKQEHTSKGRWFKVMGISNLDKVLFKLLINTDMDVLG